MSAESPAATPAAPAATPAAQFITLKVVLNSKQVVFRVKPGTKMAKLMKRYAEHTGTALRTLIFVYDGRMLKDEGTPKTLEMEDNDVIEVYQKMYGGSTQ